MLSDEMTTGSMTSSDRDKRAFAHKSHDWNKQQKRFVEAFPDVSSLNDRYIPKVDDQSVV